jgi:SAM-dependent methyltransferase
VEKRKLKQDTEKKPDYGNWVSKRLLYIFGIPSIALGATSLVLPIVILPTCIVVLCFLYFAYARYRFSPRGGNVQKQIQDLLLEHLDCEGMRKAIDIGCGSGPLAISLAKRYPDMEIVGIDYWGENWEYTKELCEKNAQREGVSARTFFQRASASSLPFDPETFDVAVSNLVFHEVKDIADKRDAIHESLRVVRKGGKFVFQDLFLWERLYGKVDDLLDIIKSWGIERVEFVQTNNSEFIPRALKLPFMLGTISIIHGTK